MTRTPYGKTYRPRRHRPPLPNLDDCPTGKVPYTGQRLAENAAYLLNLVRLSTGGTGGMEAYACREPGCPYWHTYDAERRARKVRDRRTDQRKATT